MIHSFTVTFGAKYLTGMVTSVPPYETFSLIKNDILHQSKIYKKSLRKFKFLRYVIRGKRFTVCTEIVIILGTVRLTIRVGRKRYDAHFLKKK